MMQLDDASLTFEQFNRIACGIGPELSAPEVRMLLALKINALLGGYSGSRPVVAEQLLKLLQNDVLPMIPEKARSVPPAIWHIWR